jgi:DNA polymerase-3 subunit chi
MAEVRFYHLTRYRLEEALTPHLRRVLERHDRAVILTPTSERVEALNAHLWTFDPASFLPHGSARDGHAAEQPIYLTTKLENPNRAKLLMLCDGAPAPQSEMLVELGYDLVCELFNGHDDEAVAEARVHWRQYREAGHKIAYFQQNDEGGWVEKT